MSDFDTTNRGSIWQNENKKTENHPDFTGTLNVEGREYWVSAWKRKPGANPKSPALAFSVKAKEPVIHADAVITQPGPDTLNDDIPF